jgi:hypothetical protein
MAIKQHISGGEGDTNTGVIKDQVRQVLSIINDKQVWESKTAQERSEISRKIFSFIIPKIVRFS